MAGALARRQLLPLRSCLLSAGLGGAGGKGGSTENSEARRERCLLDTRFEGLDQVLQDTTSSPDLGVP